MWYYRRKVEAARSLRRSDMQVKETGKNPRPGDGTPGPGRPKGVPNKATALLKDAILKAAEPLAAASPTAS